MFSFDLYITEDDSIEIFYSYDDLQVAAIELGIFKDCDLSLIPKVVKLAEQNAIDEHKQHG